MNYTPAALDPALPLFITASAADKLDATDADFVDVYHSNAFVQGQIERCGTVDFYMNGGIGRSIHSFFKCSFFLSFERHYHKLIPMHSIPLSICSATRLHFFWNK